MRPIAIVLAALLLLAGCGGDDGGEGEAAPPPATTAETTTEAPATTEHGGSEELDEQLRAAVLANDVAEARRLLDEGANPNAPTDTRETAFLHAASELGPDAAMLELLLEKGGDVDARDANNSTALIRAAQRGYPRLVRPLVEADSDLDHVNDLNFTALLATVIFGDGTEPYQQIVRLLIEAGADVTIPDTHGQTPLAHAQLSGQTEVAKLLSQAQGGG